MSYKYSRYINRVAKHPWAITPDKFADLIDLMRFRAMGNKLSDEDIVARFGDESERQRPAARNEGAIAVLPIHGCIAHRADAFEASSGGTSSEMIGSFFRRAVRDDGVSAIMLDFDSPGGGVEGIPELAADIFAARKVKPVWAHVNALAASAGYWLASQCEQIVCTPSGQVGSVGVFCLLIDQTAFLEKEGIKMNAISAGDHKLEGAPWEELSDESRAFFQSNVDAVYQKFLKAVATGRGVSVADVKANYGQGRCYQASEALRLGMIDTIGTAEQAIALLGKAASAKGRASVGARASAEAPAIVVGSPIGELVEVSVDGATSFVEHVDAVGASVSAAMAPDVAEEPDTAAADADAARLAQQAMADRDATATAQALAGSGR